MSQTRSDVDPTFSRQNRTIVYLTDIFGWSLINSRLLADELASHGFYVLIPDIFQGDSLDHSILFQLAPRDSAPLRSAEQIASETEIALGQVGPWLIRKRPEVTQPLIESFVKALREDSSIGKIGAAGYCWGGRYSILLADGQVDASISCHPSFMTLPDDFKNICKPISIAVGTKDAGFPTEDQELIKAYLAKELSAIPSEFRQYPNEVHGFAVRGDINVPSEKAAKEAVTKQTVDWFTKYLV